MTSRKWKSVAFAVVAATAVAIACRDTTAPTGASRFRVDKQLINPSGGTVIVYPDSMRGWAFYDDQADTVCSAGTACRMVNGPAGQPLGSGSAELADSLATDGKALILPDYGGTRFDQVTTLRYSTYRQTTDAGNNLAIALQFNVDYDLTDSLTGYQGRLVFEPRHVPFVQPFHEPRPNSQRSGEDHRVRAKPGGRPIPFHAGDEWQWQA